MNVRYFLFYFFVCAFIVISGHAQDSTQHKNPWYITIGGGVTINRAFGPMLNQVYEFDREFGIKKELQKNGTAYEIDVNFQKMCGQLVYIKTGFNYVQKQVNPEEASYPLYKDSLKTGYLQIPLLAGVAVPLNLKKTILLSVETGPTANFKVNDQTHHGIDRAGFETFSFVLGWQGGAGFTFRNPNGSGWQLLYTFRTDLTYTYNESLYWGGTNEPIRTRAYQLRTHAFTLGYVWAL